MSRVYSDKFLRQLHDNPNEVENLGVDLAKVCVKANLPMTYVSKALGVSKLTIFHWFRGREVRTIRRARVNAFIGLVEQDTREGKLPAPNTKSAKAYIEDMIGHEI